MLAEKGKIACRLITTTSLVCHDDLYFEALSRGAVGSDCVEEETGNNPRNNLTWFDLIVNRGPNF